MTERLEDGGQGEEAQLEILEEKGQQPLQCSVFVLFYFKSKKG